MAGLLDYYGNFIIMVMKDIKEDIMTRLNDDVEVQVDHLDGITNRAIQRCAAFYDVSEYKVKKTCTKELGLSIHDFYGLVKLYLLTNDLTLEEIVITHMPEGESETFLRKSLQKVRT